MAPRLHFGIEFEFCLAYQEPGQPDPSPTSTQFTVFPISEVEILDSLKNDTNRDGTPFTSEQLFRDPSRRGLRTDIFLSSARQHIRQAFIEAGLPYEHTNDHEEDIRYWHITTDPSINTTPDPKKPIEAEYVWAPMEITSPAYEYNAQNLAAVEQVCEILQTQYFTKTNLSCGLHVHFSLGITPDAPIWSFSSGPSGGYLPDPYQGVIELGRQNELAELLRTVAKKGKERYMAYNVDNIVNQLFTSAEFPEGIDENKKNPTIEFRQHYGTLDGRTATMWVKTLGGVIEWLDDADPGTYNNLLQSVLLEKWEKSGNDDLDYENEQEHGQLLAESTFRIQELLTSMGLQEQADIYTGKTYELVAQPKGSRPEKYIWEHQDGRVFLSDQEEAIYDQKEAMVKAFFAQLKALYFNPNLPFDPNASMWPAHMEPRPDEYAKKVALPPIMSGEVLELADSEELDKVNLAKSSRTPALSV
ncbi:uncharacterized protein PAC_15038 [Phialocephala subalpina]|uniref:Amidoligase enzyme n=1 Tax=Phialocephala subalpina TaxID=576137 RepID=A0A1L7XJE3_9HELO|nr:uncharacterized protein PAC_15038 [Phialocephala subalpina]